MTSPHEDILRKVLAEVTENLTTDLREVLTVALEKQISTTLTQALLESEFYRRISKDMRSGLKKIYKEIDAVSKGSPVVNEAKIDKAKTERLFSDASEQLNSVLDQTEKATASIMDFVEKHLAIQEKTAAIISEMKAGKHDQAKINELEQSNAELGDDLNSVLVSLSFQDLTGQRIKHAVRALREIESTVVQIYLSTGLLIQAYEEAPEKDMEKLGAVIADGFSGEVINSELKGPSDAGFSQKNIDDLLAQLGMD